VSHARAHRTRFPIDPPGPTPRRCGHLYCWPCLAIWIARHTTCPVCKDFCDAERVVPIYCRSHALARSASAQRLAPDIPPRPVGLRLLLPSSEQPAEPGTSLLTLGLLSPSAFLPLMSSRSRSDTSLSRQHDILMRLLLFLGSLVLMCLLLF